MPKNIVVFSDGTGQSGGVRPEQRLSNIYKLYRACRIDPLNDIDPAEQVAFYDAGLGTDEDVGSSWFKLVRSVKKGLGLATGRGISHNIFDCYNFIVDHWEPGDRIWLFGFSRGAYTARCVANVLSLCGVPTLDASGAPLQRFSYKSATIAREGVKRVYEHGAGHPLAQFEAERDEQARRFREKYGANQNGDPNASPYFIGVFDSVAALGTSGLKRAGLWVIITLSILLASAIVAGLLRWILGWPFLATTGLLFIAASLLTGAVLLKNAFRYIRDFPAKGNFKWHFISWKAANYDRSLSHRVRYARHAVSIDEVRSDFARVAWGSARVVRPKEDESDEPLIQMWFAGNHSDIGGSYPETESRLSDISLNWMVEQTADPNIPHHLLINQSQLGRHPSPAGMQHCEVEGFKNAHPFLARFVNWSVLRRPVVQGVTLHQSVLDRFALSAVSQCGLMAPYRPPNLASDTRLSHYYDVAAGAGQTSNS
jgi:uncharacterized protein (DUF2235 family)